MSRSYILGKLTGGSLIFSEFAFKKCVKWGKNNAQPRANCSPLLRQDHSVHSSQCKGLWIKVCKPMWVPGTVTYKPLGSLPPALGSFLTHALISMKQNTSGDPLQISRAQLFLWYPDLPMNTSSTFWVLALTQVVEPTNSIYFPLPMPHRGNFFKAWSWTWNCWAISRIPQFYSFSGISTLCCPMLSV